MAEWDAKPLADLVDIRSGGTPSKARADYWNGNIPWISGASLHDTVARDSERRVTPAALGNGTILAPSGSTLILVRGMSLLNEIRVGFVESPVAFNQDVKAVVPAPCMDARFLNFALRAARPTLLKKVHLAGHGTGVLATDHLETLTVPVPALEEQRRIAGVLGAFDDLIETNRKLAANLAALVSIRVSKALSESTYETSLTGNAAFVNGRNFTKSADGSGRPVIRTPEVRSGPLAGTVRSSQEADDDRLARAGDTLFVWSGTLMVNRWRHEEGLVNQHVFKVIPQDVPDWYVFALIESQMEWFRGLAKDKATTMGHIQRAHLDQPTAGLTSAVLDALHPIIQPLWSASLELEMEADDLTRQRDELLPLLMSGKVRVSELEGAAQ